MRLLVQWASSAPAGWEELESAAWAGAPKRPAPGPDTRLGTAPGYVYAIQAREDVWSGYDHVAVTHTTYQAGSDPLYDAAGVPDGEALTQITAWNDDPRDWAQGRRWARSASYFAMRPRGDLGGAIAPITRHTIYAESGIYPELAQAYARDGRTKVVELADWADLQLPEDADTKHGIWVGNPRQPDNPEARAHRDAREARSWREWADHLAPDEVGPGGRLVSQRRRGRYIPLRHTRTYYHSDTNLTSNTHTGAANPAFEHALLLTTGAAATVSTTVGTGGGEIVVATSPVGEPADAHWTSGVGTFVVRAQLDIPSAGVDLTYGLLAQGGAVGHFARVQAGVPPSVELETHPQDQAAFSGGGLHLASFTGDWAAGAASDRFEILMAAVRVVGHGNQSLSLELNESDDFTDGDWPGAAQSVPAQAATGAWVAPSAAVVAGAVVAAAGAAAGSWVAPSAGATVPPALNAPAQAASGSWVAPGPTIQPGPVQGSAGVASGSWVAPGPSGMLPLVNAPAQAASGQWDAPSPDGVVGPVQAPAAPPVASWGAQAATVVATTGAPAQAATGAWSAQAAAVVAGAVQAQAAPAVASWSAQAATVATSVQAPAQAASGSWVVPQAAVVAGAVSSVAQAASGAWVAPSASGAVGGAAVGAQAASGSWVAPSAGVAPGPVQASVVAVAASWSAQAATVAPGSVQAPAAAPGASWSAQAAAVVAGQVVSSGASASGSWVAPSAGVATTVAAQALGASGSWVAQGATVVAGAVQAQGQAGVATWASPAAGAVLGSPGVVLDAVVYPVAAVASAVYPVAVADTEVYPVAVADTEVYPVVDLETEA